MLINFVAMQIVQLRTLSLLFSGTQYNMISESPEIPWFVSEVEFKGEKFLGGGQSKRDSKQSAAANALE